ncbi:MAG: chitobiase/beta-hexosaminidase C-terminal domain-containing protein [Candidatus Sumerlaeota bacterium]
MKKLIFTFCLIFALNAVAAAQGAPVANRARLYPAPGMIDSLEGGLILGSNLGETVGFSELGRVESAPSSADWVEVRFDNDKAYRWIKYMGPAGSHGAVAEVEFYDGEKKIEGKGFGISGKVKDNGGAFPSALDGDTSTYFYAPLEDDVYVGLDIGTDENISAKPDFKPQPGHYKSPVDISIQTESRARILYTTDGNIPLEGSSKIYSEPILIEEGTTALAAIAIEPGKFRSETISGFYSIGEMSTPKGLKTFITGNSLSDTINGWLEPVARSAGYDHEHYRFSIPGAPTDWLWNHPGSGFGRPDFAQAFVDLAPIDILMTQPFSGHGRSIANEAEHGGKFYMLARESSPNIQFYLYQQWPKRNYSGKWSQGTLNISLGKEEAARLITLKEGETIEGDGLNTHIQMPKPENWSSAVANHTRYFEVLREVIDKKYPGPPVRIIPVGTALVNLKAELEAGHIPGLAEDQFFELHFGEGKEGPGYNIHMVEKGRYFVSLVVFCTIYGVPADKVDIDQATSTLTAEQAAIYKRIAWDTVREFPWAGIAPWPEN